jgi:hypothetical protein
MVPSLTTALNAAFYGRAAPTFVEPPRRRLAVIVTALCLGAPVTLWLALRYDLGTPATIALSYAATFGLMHALGLAAAADDGD